MPDNCLVIETADLHGLIKLSLNGVVWTKAYSSVEEAGRVAERLGLIESHMPSLLALRGQDFPRGCSAEVKSDYDIRNLAGAGFTATTE